jgi:hypothetical protein
MVDGRLLDEWLNIRGYEWVLPPDTFPLEVPNVTDKGVTFERRIFSVAPGSIIPIVAISRKTREVDLFWPPPGCPPTVSPEAEGVSYYGSLKSEGYDGVQTVVTADGGRALHVLTKWPAPVGPLMPLLSGMDDIATQAKMVAIVRESADDLSGALDRAKREAVAYVSEGRSTLELAWFRPEAERGRIRSLLGEAEILGLKLSKDIRERAESEEGLKGISPEELLRLDGWHDKMNELVPVRRVWGVAGLFWELLIRQLQDQRVFSACGRCGRIVRGKRGKQFCGREDNSSCYNDRRAGDMRRFRNRRVDS